MGSLDGNAINRFQERVLNWYEENSRDLPWRQNPSPYAVLVSEVMLQQTQVSRVVPKFHQFMEAFPTIKDLAEADQKHLLQVWSGLGYNRRALWLQEAARQIVQLGEFPDTADALRKLKGIGPYTSRSILIFAFNADVAAVDTNIRRVMIASGFADEEMTDCELQDIADALLVRGRSRDWHNALMDYGSMVQTSHTTGIAPRSSQPKFCGSTRQVRGAVVRLLTGCESLTLADIESEIGCERDLLKSVLDKLASEGFIELTNAMKFRIRKSS
jgi:A/G-specific adenine glycosylase